jgi:hypothetical protein
LSQQQLFLDAENNNAEKQTTFLFFILRYLRPKIAGKAKEILVKFRIEFFLPVAPRLFEVNFE